MSFQKNIKKYWDYLEQKYPSPKYVGQVKYMEFKDLKEAIDNKNEIYLKKIIRNMYVKKEAYILRKSSLILLIIIPDTILWFFLGST